SGCSGGGFRERGRTSPGVRDRAVHDHPHLTRQPGPFVSKGPGYFRLRRARPHRRNPPHKTSPVADAVKGALNAHQRSHTPSSTGTRERHCGPLEAIERAVRGSRSAPLPRVERVRSNAGPCPVPVYSAPDAEDVVDTIHVPHGTQDTAQMRGVRSEEGEPTLCAPVPTGLYGRRKDGDVLVRQRTGAV